tara:strand:- start:5375 stop:5842 length:468 start_codon:yes stop_codon:yes gene_type:complete
MKKLHSGMTISRATLALSITGGLLASVLALQGCTSVEGTAETVEFIDRAVTESDLRKKRAREAAKKQEEIRLANKKARRERNEKIGWMALAELEKYRSTHCYSGETGKVFSLFAAKPTAQAAVPSTSSRPIPSRETMHGHGEGGGGEGSGGDRGC